MLNLARSSGDSLPELFPNEKQSVRFRIQPATTRGFVLKGFTVNLTIGKIQTPYG